MMKTIIKKSPQSVYFIEKGWGNGYVIIPKGHFLNGMHYDEIHEKYEQLDVHGGLTFSDKVENLKDHWPEVKDEDADGWMVGFDTCHYMDNIKKWPKEAVQAEADKLLNQLLLLKPL